MYQKNQAIFVDARKSAFYSQQHIKGADEPAGDLVRPDVPHVPVHPGQTQGGKDKTLVVYGGTFSRRMDLDLARLLKHKGLEHVVVLKDYRVGPRSFPSKRKRPRQPAASPWGWQASWNGCR